jgi:hypothetical protein
MSAVRAEIARSGEPPGVLAKCCGMSTETTREWRQCGLKDCLDHLAASPALQALKRSVP